MIVHILNVHIFAEERTGGDYPLPEEHWINQPLQVASFPNQSINKEFCEVRIPTLFERSIGSISLIR